MAKESDLFLTQVCEDGGAATYNQWANNFESVAASVNWSGHKSVASKWQSYHMQNLSSNFEGRKHKAFDAGCGTGLLGEVLVGQFTNSNFDDLVEIYGGDVSANMLSIAKSKGIYTDLQVVDL